jgi:hypothetical protein
LATLKVEQWRKNQRRKKMAAEKNGGKKKYFFVSVVTYSLKKIPIFILKLLFSHSVGNKKKEKKLNNLNMLLQSAT